MMNKNNEQMDDLLKQMKEDLKINEFDLIGECRNAPNVTQKYLELFYNENRKLKKIKVKLDEVEGNRYQYYRKDFEIKLTSSADIMRFVNKDAEYLKVKRIWVEQSSFTEFLTSVVQNFRDRLFQLRNQVELKKIENMGV